MNISCIIKCTVVGNGLKEAYITQVQVLYLIPKRIKTIECVKNKCKLRIVKTVSNVERLEHAV
jgi:hypothetical protein